MTIPKLLDETLEQTLARLKENGRWMLRLSNN
jgi:hypothetical protein